MKPRAKASPIPASPHPMLCSPVDQPFDDPAWIFEPKLDGLRVLCRFDGQELTLMSRNGIEQSFFFPEIVEGLRESLSAPAVLDGEIVCLNERGHSDFKRLQQRFHLSQAEAVRSRMKEYPATLFLFDILYHQHFDLTDLPLERRKSILHEAVIWNDRVRWTELTEARGTRLFKEICSRLGEGIVAKRRDGKYRAERGSDWIKIKCTHRQEFAVVGFTDPKGSREGLGALLLGYHSDNGRKLLYAGKVGTGFNVPILRDLRQRLEQLERSRSPLSEEPNIAQAHWVKPELVAEIAFSDWTRHGALRHPRFLGLRPDKPADEVVRERPQNLERQSMLEKYNDKRNFKKTREPRGKRSPRGSAREKPIFVVQEHHATRLHYDFRLEAEGVLKSWAVTKKPTLDPSIKRLAVEVEDHPLDYAGFEGEIPPGQYGGGQVAIWDQGTYESLSQGSVSEAIERGRLKFRLSGSRLNGVFNLIRIRGKGGKTHWLLIKSRDDSAKLDQAARMRPGKLSILVRGRPEPVEFTHADKLMFPELGATKADVLDYYRRIAPLLLPYLRGRPITLERLPEGLAGEKAPHFWQKNTPSHYPSWIPRLQLPSEQGKAVNYVLINNEETLLYLVNQGALTFHIWASRLEDLDHPDFVLFDLDPGEAPFDKVIELARDLHTVLGERGIPSYVKTSGKSGLHVLVPWTGGGDHDAARSWASTIAEELVERNPRTATTERSKAKRAGRIYVDVLQNARGHHVVPPFVLRAVPQATISTPLKWSELTPRLKPSRFNLRTLFKLLGKRRKNKMDPMAPLLDPQKGVMNGKHRSISSDGGSPGGSGHASGIETG